MNSAIRNQYEKLGVDAYYRQHAADYKNPHAKQAVLCVEHALEVLPPISTALDLACGDGLVTRKLSQEGVRVTGCDPYMESVYTKATGCECLPYSFKDIATRGLPQVFDAVFCSYALHLAEESLLPQLEYQLSLCTGFLVIITPNKKPELKTHWTLVHEENLERTRLRIYSH